MCVDVRESECAGRVSWAPVVYLFVSRRKKREKTAVLLSLHFLLKARRVLNVDKATRGLDVLERMPA